MKEAAKETAKSKGRKLSKEKHGKQARIGRKQRKKGRHPEKIRIGPEPSVTVTNPASTKASQKKSCV